MFSVVFSAFGQSVLKERVCEGKPVVKLNKSETPLVLLITIHFPSTLVLYVMAFCHVCPCFFSFLRLTPFTDSVSI